MKVIIRDMLCLEFGCFWISCDVVTLNTQAYVS